MTVAIRYARKSAQQKSRRSTSPETQLAECAEYAEAKGWDLYPESFIDPETSAYRRRNGKDDDEGKVKHRPGFEALARAIQAGGIEVVLCWDVNRITRDTEVGQSFAKLCRKHGVAVEDVRGNRYDLSTQRGYSEFVGACNAAEIDSARKSEMVTRELAIAAKEGAPHGGRDSFGYSRVRRSDSSEPTLLIDEDQAAYVREGAAKMLRGESLRSIADLWAEAWPGVSRVQVRAVLISPRIAGLRTHLGTLHPGNWEPILDRQTWDEVVAVLTAPGRRTNPGRPPSYLLSSIPRCGAEGCGSPLQSKSRGHGRQAYSCPDNHVARSRQKLDAFVEAVLFDSIDGGALARLAASMTKDDPNAARIAEERKRLNAKRDRIIDMASDDMITKSEAATRLAEVKADLDRLDARQSVSADRKLVESIPEGEAFGRWWAAADLTSCRWLVRSLLQITVHPARRGVRELEGVDVVPLV